MTDNRDMKLSDPERCEYVIIKGQFRDAIAPRVGIAKSGLDPQWIHPEIISREVRKGGIGGSRSVTVADRRSNVI